MVKLYDSGVYLLNGKTLVPENEAVGIDKETARKGTISYGILQAHNQSGDPKNLKMFKDLFLLSVANVAINVLLSALGVFGLGGIFY